MKSLLLLTLLTFSTVLVGSGQTDPGDGLSAVSNFWGRDTTGQFRQRLFAALPSPSTNNYSEIMRTWFLDFVSYPDMLQETEKPYWMVEKSFLIYFFSQTPPVGTSTNCWHAAAELLRRYREILRAAESNACEAASLGNISGMTSSEIQQRFDLYRESRMKAHSLKNIVPALSNAVTNGFPKCILPMVPEDGRAAMMTNVLKTAGW